MLETQKTIIIDGIEVVTTSPDYAFIIGIGVVFIIGFMLYFLPTMIAIARKHRDRLVIFILNFFLGWSIFGWIIALILALSKKD